MEINVTANPASAGSLDFTEVTVNTTDAVATQITSIATTTDSVTELHITFLARKTGGAGSGSVGDSGTYVRLVKVDNASDVLTIAFPIDEGTDEDNVAWDISFASSGANLLVRVQGDANNNVSWKATYRTAEV